jgi:hypothetical protein
VLGTSVTCVLHVDLLHSSDGLTRRITPTIPTQFNERAILSHFVGSGFNIRCIVHIDDVLCKETVVLTKFWIKLFCVRTMEYNKKMFPRLEFVVREHFLKSYGLRADAASMTQPPPRQCCISLRHFYRTPFVVSP